MTARTFLGHKLQMPFDGDFYTDRAVRVARGQRHTDGGGVVYYVLTATLRDDYKHSRNMRADVEAHWEDYGYERLFKFPLVHANPFLVVPQSVISLVNGQTYARGASLIRIAQPFSQTIPVGMRFTMPGSTEAYTVRAGRRGSGNITIYPTLNQTHVASSGDRIDFATPEATGIWGRQPRFVDTPNGLSTVVEFIEIRPEPSS